MSFDLENLREMEKKAEELKAEVKALEQRKSELSNTEQRALEKEKYQLLLEEKRQLKQRKKEERKALKERKRDSLRHEDPEPSFFAKDYAGRNGIHKLGSFTWKAFFAGAICTVINIFIVWPIFEGPNFDQAQLISRIIAVSVACYFGVKGWKGNTDLKLENQFILGIVTLILGTITALGYMRGIDVDDKLNDALTPDSWEKKEDKPSQD